MNRVFLLLAEFETAQIPLEKICKPYFNLDYETACNQVKAHKFPVPATRLGSQKSPWIVDVHDLARYIDKQLDSARKTHEQMNAA